MASEMIERSKQGLLDCLAIDDGDLTVRGWCRRDVDLRAEWPPYPPPYSEFTSAIGAMAPAERDAYYRVRDQDQRRITLTADHASESCIAHMALLDANRGEGTVDNMGLRVHPNWCGRGVGTRVLRLVVTRLTDAGFQHFRLDVSEANARAIRCYEKVGFVRTEPFNRDGVPFCWMALESSEVEHGMDQI